jgi:hypothetical protein
MKHNDAETPPFAPRLRLMVCLATLAVAFTVSRPPLAHADHVTPPDMPDNIQMVEGEPVEEGNKAFLEGHADGTQNYICLPCPNATTPEAMCPDTSGFVWTFFGPQATLFNDHEKQIITHFLSPNLDPIAPEVADTPRVTWQHSRDTSTIWAVAIARSSDPNFVKPDAIPWLLLRVVGAQDGPTGGDKLSETTFIQRLNTSEGVAPSTGCTLSTDVGKMALVPYKADYFFYKAIKRK